MRPGRSLFAAALVAVCIGAVSYFIPFLFKIWLYYLILIVPFIIADMIVLLHCMCRPFVARTMNTSLALGRLETVELMITWEGRGIIPGKIKIFDLYDDLFDCDAFPSVAEFHSAGEKIHFSYEIMPIERGNWEFSGCDLLISSQLHFWQLKIHRSVITRGRVYPDFKLLTSSSALDAVVELQGQKSLRKRGTGLEFDRLRSWQNGDSIRAVDWRATSRLGKVIIREYIEEQDQQVLFMLDSGYRLHRQETAYSAAQSLTITQFDSALNAAFFLAWTALKHGDAVAGALFGNMERWVPPRRGLSALPVLMNTFYDAKSAPCPSSILQALENAMVRLKRRTFITLISNFREEDEEPLMSILCHAGKRHLLLLVNIIEPEIETFARFKVPNESLDNQQPHPFSRAGIQESALIAASAQSYLDARRKMMTRWERQGFLTLETSAASLTPKLVNTYLKIKRSGEL